MRRGRKPDLSVQEADEVREAYYDRQAKWTVTALARCFRVSTGTIQAVLNRTGAYQMTDPTEPFRRAMLAANQPAKDLEHATDRWDTDALREQFEVLGFLAPFVVVKRRSDGAKGSLEFTHSPRIYFNWRQDR